MDTLRSGRLLQALLTMLLLLEYPHFTGGGAIQDPFAGEWRQADFEGVRAWDNGACQALYVTERILAILPQDAQAGMNLRGGVYTNMKHGRLVLNGTRQCRLPDTNPATFATYENMRTWQLVARPTGTSDFAVEGTFDVEKGDPCPECKPEPFKTVFRVTDEGVRDTFATPDTADDLVFRTESERNKVIGDGQEAARAFARAIDSEDYRAAYALFGQRWLGGATREQFVGEFERMGAAIGTVTSRSTFEKYYVNRMWDGTNWATVEAVYFTTRILTSKQLGGLEFWLLERSGGQWRMAMYRVIF